MYRQRRRRWCSVQPRGRIKYRASVFATINPVDASIKRVWCAPQQQPQVFFSHANIHSHDTSSSVGVCERVCCLNLSFSHYLTPRAPHLAAAACWRTTRLHSTLDQRPAKQNTWSPPHTEHRPLSFPSLTRPCAPVTLMLWTSNSDMGWGKFVPEGIVCERVCSSDAQITSVRFCVVWNFKIQ